MAKKKIELDFLLNDTAWKIENVSTSGAKIKPIRITEILIHSNNVRYEYAGDSSTGFFFTSDIGDTIFESNLDALEHCKYVKDENIDCDFSYIFFAVRKHITNFDNFTRFNIRLRHTINTNLAYFIIDKCDKINPNLRNKAVVDKLIGELTEDDVDSICEKRGICYKYHSGVHEVSAYSHVSNHNFDTEEDCYTIDAWKTDDENEEGKVIAKVSKIGALIFMPETNCADPKLCDAIEDVLVNKL